MCLWMVLCVCLCMRNWERENEIEKGEEEWKKKKWEEEWKKKKWDDVYSTVRANGRIELKNYKRKKTWEREREREREREEIKREC